MKIIGIIPARMQSSRFPGKPLVNILGLPMIIHVLKRAKLCRNLFEVFVATDSLAIFDCVVRYGGKAIMTSAAHKTGTDRIAEASENMDCDIIVNIQGDEALVGPHDIDKLVECIKREEKVNFATLVCKTYQFCEMTECKVVLSANGDIMYMSRADIPSNARSRVESMHKLYCVVAFRKEWLKVFASWNQTELEKIEYIEYLRILENGHKIRSVIVDKYAISVDTPDDLKSVSEMMKRDPTVREYLNG